jgi:hypothetical protein
LTPLPNLTREQEFLLKTGMVNKMVYAGIQPDDCVVDVEALGGHHEARICNHNCTTEYVCGASYSLNRGAKPNFASRETIVGWTLRTARAQEIARDIFFERHFNAYCEDFQIPPSWAAAIKAEITSPYKKVEVNRFGTPEMLRDSPEIIGDCKEAGLIVNMTTPGLRFMHDAEFVKKIADNPPHMIAVSVDAVGVNELPIFGQMDLQQLKTECRRVAPHHGQRRKAYEGFYTALLMRRMQVSTTMLFNMVVHESNVDYFTDILDVLGETIPNSLANPYPAQAFPEPNTNFADVPPCWKLESLPALSRLVQYFIDRTLRRPKGITSRLHYYIVLESAFRKWGKCDQERLAQFMSGIWAWSQTRRPGAYRYAQIGNNPHFVPSGSLVQIGDRPTDRSKRPSPGGHFGCYWNPVWAYKDQVPDNPEEIADRLMTGVVERGRQFAEQGHGRHMSNIMPRLMFDLVTTELGLPLDLIPEYLATRMEIAGF